MSGDKPLKINCLFLRLKERQALTSGIKT